MYEDLLKEPLCINARVNCRLKIAFSLFTPSTPNLSFCEMVTPIFLKHNPLIILYILKRHGMMQITLWL